MKLEFLLDGSPDCPLIRLYEFDQTETGRLIEIVNRLSSGSRQAIALHKEVWIESVGGYELDLRLTDKNLGIIQTDSLSFVCLLTADKWSVVADLIQPFCDTTHTNEREFQWLNEDSEISLLLSTDGGW